MAHRPSREHRAISYLRAMLAPPPRRVRPPRERRVLSYRSLLRGIFMLQPRLRCTVCGSPNIRPSSTPLSRLAQAFGLSPYRCKECDHLLALPFRS